MSRKKIKEFWGSTGETNKVSERMKRYRKTRIKRTRREEDEKNHVEKLFQVVHTWLKLPEVKKNRYYATVYFRWLTRYTQKERASVCVLINWNT